MLSFESAYMDGVCVHVCIGERALERKFVYHFCSNVQLGIITNDHNGLFIEKYQRDARLSVASHRNGNTAVDCLI